MKLKKIKCEIENCNITDPALLHAHHIIERKEIGTSNHPMNLAILCACHHEMLHDNNRLKIIGVFPSTNPSGRTLVYILDGKQNVEGIDESYFKNRPPQSKIGK